jgi:hypothetical protein
MICTSRVRHQLGRSIEDRSIKEFPLNTAKSGRTMTADKAGNIWFSQLQGLRRQDGIRNPARSSYQMPDPVSRDPHTPI